MLALMDAPTFAYTLGSDGAPLAIVGILEARLRERERSEGLGPPAA